MVACGPLLLYSTSQSGSSDHSLWVAHVRPTTSLFKFERSKCSRTVNAHDKDFCHLVQWQRQPIQCTVACFVCVQLVRDWLVLSNTVLLQKSSCRCVPFGKRQATFMVTPQPIKTNETRKKFEEERRRGKHHRKMGMRCAPWNLPLASYSSKVFVLFVGWKRNISNFRVLF